MWQLRCTHVHLADPAVTIALHPPDRPAPRFLCACPSAGASTWSAHDPEVLPKITNDIEEILLWARRQDVRVKRDKDAEKVRHDGGSNRQSRIQTHILR